MNDLISRQAAIEALLKLVEARRTWISIEDARKEIRGIDASMCAIHDLPSAQPEQQWIPVSERMPEVGHNVLISVDDGYVAEGCKTVDNTWVQYRWSTVLPEEKIIAWMPLPEPPKDVKV